MNNHDKLRQMEADLLVLGKELLELQTTQGGRSLKSWYRLIDAKNAAIERKKADINALKHGEQGGLFSE